MGDKSELHTVMLNLELTEALARFIARIGRGFP